MARVRAWRDELADDRSGPAAPPTRPRSHPPSFLGLPGASTPGSATHQAPSSGRAKATAPAIEPICVSEIDTVTRSSAARCAAVHSPGGRARRAWRTASETRRSMKPRNSPDASTAPTTPTTTKPPPGSAATAHAWRSLASCSSAATTPCANSETRPWRPPSDCSRCARSPHRHRCPAAGSPHAPAATVTTWPAQKDRAAAPRQPAGTPHQPSRHRPAARPDRGPR